MLEFHLIVYFLFVLIQFLVGVFANGFIVVVNTIDLIKQRKLAPLNLLLFCLAITRLCLQLLIFNINLVILSMIEWLIFPSNFSIHMLVNESELWFATWLGVFYCAKIATVPHPLFIWLKMRITKLVPWQILGTLLYTSIICIFQNNYTWRIPPAFSVHLFSPNATTQITEVTALQLAFLVFGFSTPLLIFLVAVLLLIFSLGKHSRQMRSTTMGSRDSRRSAHISAMLSIFSFLVLYFSHYMMAALLSSQYFQLRSFVFLFCMLVVGTYPSGHSLILILGNPRLKQSARKFLFYSKSCQ
ncbi:taste receptor type 2 member 1 [Carlito syrichta]|uniref:Taste receptor type 2 n=1 Tax=Carlito syrichta TaxID=1868482 RepID=A0A1U7TSS4_CARSF|nr:taste receptor type 2 member 1 [Carlito syrichta]